MEIDFYFLTIFFHWFFCRALKALTRRSETSNVIIVSRLQRTISCTFQYYESLESPPSWRTNERKKTCEKQSSQVARAFRVPVNRVILCFAPGRLSSTRRIRAYRCAHKLQRSFAACTGARVRIGLLRRRRLQFAPDSLVYSSEQRRQSRFEFP